MTLTTVGYGDIAPAVDWVRAVAVVEALAGQIFLVVLIARLVGMHIAQSLAGSRSGPSPAAAD
ncbi:MAG: two pore domain potassium channel family protein [Actinomycetia bacterium]|nr:two pore domain potassium channel family protein [Actinomycetes bacterium]